MSEEINYRLNFNRTITDTISHAVRFIAADPALFIAGTRILRNQRKATALRREHEKDGLVVPPVMIASITSRCNLSCAGCYMHGRAGEHLAEMSPEVLASVIGQAADLGVSIVVIAGGEPLVRLGEILQAAHAHPGILFPVFTNGLLIDEAVAGALAESRNIVPVISFEGFRGGTDLRRGAGVYNRLLSACTLLRSRGIFFGCSVTTTRNNFGEVTDEAFVREMLETGARVFAFVEYVPMAPGTADLVLSREQKRTLQTVLTGYNRKFPAIFIGFPGDEDVYGGCLAAGRGFVHVSPSGNLEPCPAAPYSDANLAGTPLKEALRSRLLGRLRESPQFLTETSGGCALRADPSWVGKVMCRE